MEMKMKMKLPNMYDIFILYSKYVPLLAVLYSVIYIIVKHRKNRNTQIKPVFYFLIYIGINNILNNILKGLIRSPRPNSSSLTYSPITNSDVYGMPSAHVQNMAFITTYLYKLYPSDTYFHLFNVFNIFITGYQRYIQNNHTILQLIGGLIVGVLFGLFSIGSSITSM